MNTAKKTEKTYGFLWARQKSLPPQKWHFNAMQEVIDEPIVKGNIGIEVGCGCGYDTYIMANANPAVRIVSMDISEGIHKAKELTRSMRNVSLVRSSAMNIPVRDGVFDFAYSFGVLHHTENPGKGFIEIARVLKKNASVFMYLYEDHRANPFKYHAIKFTSQIRKITTRMSPRTVYLLSCLLSPFIFIIFTMPSKAMMNFRATRRFGEKMPFNFGTDLFSLRGDLYDRLSAPLEYRFGRRDLGEALERCGFRDIRITRLDKTAGWVVWGRKDR